MATKIWVNIGSGNGLLPDGTKPLPEPSNVVDFPSVKSSDIHIREISQEMPQPSITKNLFENYISKILFKFPRGQLMCNGHPNIIVSFACYSNR